MEPPLLQVRDLTKKFGNVTSVNGVSFDIGDGEILGLLGANGAGKTTAINMVLGIVTPTGGHIEVFGKELMANRIEVLRSMNFCSTYTQLPGNLRVWQNLKVFGQIYRVPNLKTRIDEVLEMLEISHLKERVSGELSAGEGTRLILCKALLNRPRLLLLDERGYVITSYQIRHHISDDSAVDSEGIKRAASKAKAYGAVLTFDKGVYANGLSIEPDVVESVRAALEEAGVRLFNQSFSSSTGP